MSEALPEIVRPPAKIIKPPTLSHRVEYYSLRAAIAGLGKLDWETACRIGERVGELGYRPLGIRKQVVERQIAAAFPELDARGVGRIARGSYRNLGRTAVEAALLPRLGEKGVMQLVDRVEGWEHIIAGVSARRGGVVVAAHHGNWELLGAYTAARDIKLEVVVREMDNRLFENYVNTNRTRLGLTVVHDQVAVRRTARALREGRHVAFLADQGVMGLASSFVPFFGRMAKTPRGFAVFALRFDVPVCFMDAVRLPNGKFRIIVEPIEAARTGDREKDVDALVARYSEVLEKWVRLYPEQYFWQHRRWRRQPPGTPPERGDPALE